jgi:acetyl-CoA synthetase
VSTTASEAFRVARNELLGWRGDHRAAVSGFRWPDLGDRFN